MNDECEVIPLFSTPLFIGKIDADTELLLDSISKLKFVKYDAPGLGSENQQVLNLKEFQFLRNEIDKAFEIYLYEILMYKKNSTFTFAHETSWANLHRKNDFCHLHTHPNSMYSFIFFVDVDENSGNIAFSSGNRSTFCYSAFDIPVSSNNVLNSHEFSLTPEVNTIMIFPSHVSHHVTVNNSEKERYTIAGNYFGRGTINEVTQNIRL